MSTSYSSGSYNTPTPGSQSLSTLYPNGGAGGGGAYNPLNTNLGGSQNAYGNYIGTASYVSSSGFGMGFMHKPKRVVSPSFVPEKMADEELVMHKLLDKCEWANIVDDTQPWYEPVDEICTICGQKRKNTDDSVLYPSYVGGGGGGGAGGVIGHSSIMPSGIGGITQSSPYLARQSAHHVVGVAPNTIFNKIRSLFKQP